MAAVPFVSSTNFILVRRCLTADKYFTPITPNGWTFSIWGLIFTGEALYAIFQLLPSQRNRAYHKDIAGWVMCAFVLQSLWLLCWYGWPGWAPLNFACSICMSALIVFLYWCVLIAPSSGLLMRSGARRL